MSILEQIQADTREAMKAGERERVGVLRLLTNALQQELKTGNDDEVAVLRREHKRRIEAAGAYRDGGIEERAAAEEGEAAVIESYMPAQISDEELDRLVADAVSESGAEGPKDMGRAIGAAMKKVGDGADGKRVSAAVRAKLSG